MHECPHVLREGFNCHALLLFSTSLQRTFFWPALLWTEWEPKKLSTLQHRFFLIIGQWPKEINFLHRFAWYHGISSTSIRSWKQITMDHGVLPSSHLCLAKNSTTASGLHFFRQSLKTAAFITFLRARQRSQLEIYSCSYSATGEHLSLNFAKWQMDCWMASWFLAYLWFAFISARQPSHLSGIWHDLEKWIWRTWQIKGESSWHRLKCLNRCEMRTPDLHGCLAA